MRIIDKNKDFYDYLQDPTDTIVFERKGSFLLTKERIREALRRDHWHRAGAYDEFILLQVCNSFWLFLVSVDEVDKDCLPVDYKVSLIAKWKDYNKERKLIELNLIKFNWQVLSLIRNVFQSNTKCDTELINKNKDKLVYSISIGEYRIEENLGREFFSNDRIPLLKASRLAQLIDPLEIFLSFEEYFSLEKSKNEKTESIGITDKDKIEMHGFDNKTSFRGKIK